MTSTGTFDRATALARLASERFDVLVIGGGITGAGVALDAASRGLRTALVERDDFASGTSSRSSKMIHGGLRYLQHGDVRLVYQALRERHRLVRNAPHLVSIEPILLPLFTENGLMDHRVARLLGAAMWAYDLTGGWRVGKLHDRLSVEECERRVPTLPRNRISGGYLYYDGRADDARLTLSVVRTAALDHGAVVANRVRVTAMVKDASGKVTGVLAEADGEPIEIRAAVVVNAAGVWSDEVARQDQPGRPPGIRPAKGVHLTLPRSVVGGDISLGLPAGKHGSIFVALWGDLVYVGTTDTEYDGPVDDPQCTPEDIAFLLRAVNSGLDVNVTEADIVGTWAGLRPLVAAGSGRTRDMSRRHHLSVSTSGIVSIAGGKLTTYREMAAHTVDAVVRLLGGRRSRRSRTKRLSLRGADGVERARSYRGLAPDVVTHLAGRYGGEATDLFALLEKRPDLLAPLVRGLPYLLVEAVHAARSEMATTLDDVLSRRTRARLLARDASADAAGAVAEVLAGELGWSEARCRAEVESYRASVAAERTAAGLGGVGLLSEVPALR